MKQAVSIFLAKTKAKAVKAWLKNDQVVRSEVLEVNLAAEDDFYKFLVNIKKKFKIDKIRLLIDQNLVFIDLLTWPASEKLNEVKLLEDVKALIPDDLDGDLIKWSERGQIENEKGSQKLIQFLVIDKDFWQKVQVDFKKANLEIADFEPAFASLLRLTNSNDEAHLMRIDEHRLIVFHGIMYASAVIIAGNDKEKEEQALIAYVEEKWGLKTKKIVNVDLNQVILNSFLQDDLCCQDDKVEEDEKKKYWWLLALLFLITLIISSVIYWEQLWNLMAPYFNFNETEKTEEQIIVVDESTPEIEEIIKEVIEEDVAIPAASLSRSEIKIKILNGSGISGLAGELEDNLLLLNYDDSLINVANAEREDYETSILMITSEKAAIADLLYSDLQAKMDLEVKVDNDSISSLKDFDIIIIIGKEGQSINEEN